jgi:hypothetical protein
MGISFSMLVIVYNQLIAIAVSKNIYELRAQLSYFDRSQHNSISLSLMRNCMGA